MAGRANSSARRGWLVAGVAAALALLVVVGRIQQGGLVPHRSTPAPAPATTIARSLPITATIRLGTSAAPQFADGAQLMVGEGRLWAVLDGVLVRVDPRRPRTVARTRLGRPGQPGDFMSLLAIGAGAVWVGTEAGVVRFDPATTRAAGTLPNDNPLWAAGADSLWSVRCTSEGGPCRLLRLDPHSLHATARFPLPGLPAGPPVVGDDSVWLLDQSGRWLWRVGLAGGRVARVRLPSVVVSAEAEVPTQLVVGEGAVWVLTSVESPTPLGSRVDVGLVRIDPHANRVSAITPLANLGGDPYNVRLAVGAEGVWVEGQQRPEGGQPRAVIDRVDPASGRLRGTIETGDLSPAALAAGFGALWLLRPAAGTLLRLDPAAM
jgi:hypothetical protein